MEKETVHNSQLTCRNCPAMALVDKVSSGSYRRPSFKGSIGSSPPSMAECKRRPVLGNYDPNSITFRECPEWQETPYGYRLKDMKVLILGIDGYLGWTLALWLSNIGCKVSGVDNFSRRDWVKERGARTIVPISRMTERLSAAKEVFDMEINFRQLDILNERERLKEFIDEIKPEAIVHYGECPSAPYSMIDVEHAIEVQKNNVLGTLGVLFSMRDIVPDSSLIKLGTMGEYGTPLSGRPLFEGMFPADATLKWDNREWSLGGEITPRDPGSFYHISKVQDTHNVMGACKYWWLRSYDVMQGVIYGVHTDQVSADPRLRTRLDIDEWFGTVINRFVSQAVIGLPLTLYGAGEQIRGFIALEDAMQCMTRLIFSPPEMGQYAVVNQMSGYYSLWQLAQTVARIGKKEFNLSVEIQRLENPRVESENHPFDPINENLSKKYGFKPEVELEEELSRMFELLTQPEIKKRIEEKKYHIIPKTWWSGEKREVQTIEIIPPGS